MDEILKYWNTDEFYEVDEGMKYELWNVMKILYNEIPVVAHILTIKFHFFLIWGEVRGGEKIFKKGNKKK
jgi:hypothetical protein